MWSLKHLRLVNTSNRILVLMNVLNIQTSHPTTWQSPVHTYRSKIHLKSSNISATSGICGISMETTVGLPTDTLLCAPALAIVSRLPFPTQSPVATLGKRAGIFPLERQEFIVKHCTATPLNAVTAKIISIPGTHWIMHFPKNSNAQCIPWITHR